MCLFFASLLILFARPVFASGASVFLYPANQDVTLGRSTLVDVILDTADLKISGFDIVLDIDDRYFLTKVIPGKAVTLSSYSLLAGRQAVFSSQSPYKGMAVIGSVQMIPTKNGQTKVAVNFSKSKIFGSDGVTNILDSSTDASFLIKGEVLAGATASGQIAAPQTGIVENMLIIFAGDLILAYIGKKLWTI